MSRKTFPVQALLEKVNFMLAVEDPYLKAPGKDRLMTPAEAFRMAAAGILEGVLFDTGNYHGFGYREVDASTGAGEIADETRRVYYGGR